MLLLLLPQLLPNVPAGFGAPVLKGWGLGLLTSPLLLRLDFIGLAGFFWGGGGKLGARLLSRF